MHALNNTEFSTNSSLIVLVVNHKISFFGGYVKEMTNMLGDLRGTPVASVQVVSTNVDGNICKYHLSIKNQISRLAMCMLGTCCQIIL